jgi:ATP-dependent Zn protease
MKSKTRLAIAGACLAGVLWVAAASRQGQGLDEPGPVKLIYSQFLDQVKSGEINSVIIAGTHATCRMKDGRIASVVLPPDYGDALAAMRHNQVDVEIGEEHFLSNAAPFLVLLGVWIVLLIIRRIPRHGPPLVC